jgi:hypothetical protein
MSRPAARCAGLGHSMWRCLVALCFAALLPGAALAQTQFGQGGQSGVRSIDSRLELLAQLPSLRAAEVDPLLRQVGFTPNMSDQDWRSLSTREQIETAYRSADAAGGDNGERFVHNLARQIETKYESVAFDPVFQSQFMSDAPLPGPVNYAMPSQFQRTAPLPHQVSVALDSLSVYVEGSGPLGRVNVLRSHFNLRSPELEQALARRNTRAMLAFAAIKAVPPPTVDVRVNRLARDAVANFDSAGADHALRDALNRMNANAAEPAVAPRGQALAVAEDGLVVPDVPGGGGGGAGSPDRVARAAQAHASLDRAHYQTAASRKFSNVRMRAGGRGGVIAGSPVTAPVGIGTPRIIWIYIQDSNCATAHGMETQGSVVLDFVDGKRLQLVGVPCDAMVASKRVVYDSIAGVGPWVPGDAIGLVSIALDRDQTAFPLFIPKDLDAARIGRRMRMILHPGLTDLDIGRSIALLDLWPSAAGALVEASARSPQVTSWLRDLHEMEASTWKWSDAPMSITVEEARLKVTGGPLGFRAFDGIDSLRERLLERTEDELRQFVAECRAPNSEEMRQLCNQVSAAVSRTDSGRDMGTFRLAAADMTKHVYDVRRAAQFMQVLAVFRWARQQGAQIAGAEPRLPSNRTKTPESILIGFDGSWIATATSTSNYNTDCLVFFDRFGKLKQHEATQPAVGSDGLRRSMLVQVLDRTSTDLKGCKLPG